MERGGSHMRKEWKVPHNINRQTWSVIEYTDYNVVVPTTDSQPHEIESLTCPCNPRVEMEMVVHNSWRDEAKVDNAITDLFGL